MECVTREVWIGTVDQIVQKVKELQHGYCKSDVQLTYSGVRKQLQRIIGAYSYMYFNVQQVKIKSVVGIIYYVEFSTKVINDKGALGNDITIPQIDFKLASKIVKIVQ